MVLQRVVVVAVVLKLLQGLVHEENGGNMFYEATYGYEGAVTTTVLLVVLISILIYHLHKKGQLKDTMSIFPADETAGEAKHFSHC